MLDVRLRADLDRSPPLAGGLAPVDPDVVLADQMLAAAKEAGLAMPEPVADFAIDAFDAEALLDRVPRPMSRGELQLCSLLITLAVPFERLELLEPTAGLDLQRRRALVGLLVDLAAEHDIVVTSADPLFDPYRG